MKTLFDLVFAIIAKAAVHYICRRFDCKFTEEDSKPIRQFL